MQLEFPTFISDEILEPSTFSTDISFEDSLQNFELEYPNYAIKSIKNSPDYSHLTKYHIERRLSEQKYSQFNIITDPMIASKIWKFPTNRKNLIDEQNIKEHYDRLKVTLILENYYRYRIVKINT